MQSHSIGNKNFCKNRKFFSRHSPKNHTCSHLTPGQFSTLQAYLVPIEWDCKHIWSLSKEFASIFRFLWNCDCIHIRSRSLSSLHSYLPVAAFVINSPSICGPNRYFHCECIRSKVAEFLSSSRNHTSHICKQNPFERCYYHNMLFNSLYSFIYIRNQARVQGHCSTLSNSNYNKSYKRFMCVYLWFNLYVHYSWMRIRYHLETEIISELQVDNSRGTKMLINIDFTMSNLPCNYFSVDAMGTGYFIHFLELITTSTTLAVK